LGLHWLQIAYARIRSADGFQRLKRMEIGFGTERRNLDVPIALALGLTSYVSDSRPAVRSISCSRGPEPRDALDRLILGWERGDLGWLESSLEEVSRTRLHLLIKEYSWEGLQNHLWSRRGAVAVGYRFAGGGRWSEPPITLGPGWQSEDPANGKSDRFELDTIFLDSQGAECGRRRIQFARRMRSDTAVYLIDQVNVLDLLRLIASCATQSN
jgi:hypothetical protein